LGLRTISPADLHKSSQAQNIAAGEIAVPLEAREAMMLRSRSSLARTISPACILSPLLSCSFKKVQMDRTVDVTIPVEPEAAEALADARNREAVGRLVSRVLRPRSGPSPLAQAIAELKAEARAAGLTDAEIDAELAAYNAERRDRRTGD
jgi:hypothetical protein